MDNLYVILMYIVKTTFRIPVTNYDLEDYQSGNW